MSIYSNTSKHSDINTFEQLVLDITNFYFTHPLYRISSLKAIELHLLITQWKFYKRIARFDLAMIGLRR